MMRAKLLKIIYLVKISKKSRHQRGHQKLVFDFVVIATGFTGLVSLFHDVLNLLELLIELLLFVFARFTTLGDIATTILRTILAYNFEMSKNLDSFDHIERQPWAWPLAWPYSRHSLRRCRSQIGSSAPCQTCRGPFSWRQHLHPSPQSHHQPINSPLYFLQIVKRSRWNFYQI